MSWKDFLLSRCKYEQIKSLSKLLESFSNIDAILLLKSCKNIDPKNIPCHRVIRSDGSLAKGYAFGGAKKQKEVLEKEGIKFDKGKIDLERYSFNN